MSLTETAKHWLWGCTDTTAASRSDVNVAMPHLRGKWSPTKAILRSLETSFMWAFPFRPCAKLPGSLTTVDAAETLERSDPRVPIACIATETRVASGVYLIGLVRSVLRFHSPPAFSIDGSAYLNFVIA